MAVYLTGSVAYDRIMNFPGVFTDSILPDRIHDLNVSFFIDRLDEKLGGNGGNIAYSLALLGEKPLILGTVGKDFAPYAAVLDTLGLSMEGIKQLDEERTASAYITTDRSGNQITAFHAAAMMTPCGYTFPHLDPANDLALIGPSNIDDMREHPALYRQRKVRYIYDPAQQLPVVAGGDLADAVAGAWLLVGNDYEIRLIQNRLGVDETALAAMTGIGLIATMGEKGSMYLDPAGKRSLIPAVPVTKVADPTGAGDAYRSGLIKGLLAGQSPDRAGRIGAVCAAYCIESHGTQGHHFSPAEFAARFELNFSEKPY